MLEYGELTARIILMVPVWISLTVHEWAHARSALALGDDTAARLGRCSLSPFAHIDFLGTFLLPLLGIPFGWAKPVPINPLRFNTKLNTKTAVMLTALAGPAANIVIAILCAILLNLANFFLPQMKSALFASLFVGIVNFIKMLLVVNVGLACFNLLPIPPLDGSRVADFFMPRYFRPIWNKIYQSGFITLIVLFFLIYFFRIPLFGVISYITRTMLNILIL